MAKASSQIGAVQAPHGLKVLLQPAFQAAGQQGAAILAALAIAHGELPAGKIQILHPQAQRLHTAQLSQHSPHLLRGEHHR